MQRDGLLKQFKVVDMMLTMHSILAARYRRRAKLVELTRLGVAILLVSLTFADPQLFTRFKVRPESARIYIGGCSISLFFLSIVSLIVDWKGTATRHLEAFNSLVRLKTEWRELMDSYQDLDEHHRLEFTRKSALIVGNLIPIPDNQFNRLKARHHRKVMISKLISECPGSSVIALSLSLWWRSTWKGVRHGAEKPSTNA